MCQVFCSNINYSRGNFTLAQAFANLRGKLDLLGTDDMPVDKYHYPKSGPRILMVPAGKKCRT